MPEEATRFVFHGSPSQKNGTQPALGIINHKPELIWIKATDYIGHNIYFIYKRWIPLGTLFMLSPI